MPAVFDADLENGLELSETADRSEAGIESVEVPQSHEPAADLAESELETELVLLAAPLGPAS